jgi:hypothetical protein
MPDSEPKDPQFEVDLQGAIASGDLRENTDGTISTTELGERRFELAHPKTMKRIQEAKEQGQELSFPEFVKSVNEDRHDRGLSSLWED